MSGTSYLRTPSLILTLGLGPRRDPSFTRQVGDSRLPNLSVCVLFDPITTVYINHNDSLKDYEKVKRWVKKVRVHMLEKGREMV